MADDLIGAENEPQFWFEEIEPFRAVGLRRCATPGCGIVGTRHGNMIADFWRDRHRHVVVRFAWSGWHYHYRAVLAGGKPIEDRHLDAFLYCVQDALEEWMVEPPDCPPELPMAPEPE